ncbi:MAG: HNH endonuclease [Selenomonadaceae bacterium]|nr:HNH endonuclease [Selenomonadaceae bacterium]MBR0060458.1 HNH endonuclease [Selenomonadaceae bacterium]
MQTEKIKPFRIHRLVASAFIPNPENKPQVNHIDGHTMNNHISNLEWVTGSENQRHAVKAGLRKSGEDNYNAKLTNEQVRYIRENPLGLTQPQLAEKFGVAQVSISDIQLGKLYKQAGGIIHSKRQGGVPRVPDDIREQIRAEYKAGVYGCGSCALAKKYGLVHSTVLSIIHET